MDSQFNSITYPKFFKKALMDNNKVSVIMTSFNREKYIGEAIESVLGSTYSNFELLIVDDCSKDRTVEIATSYSNKDKRIKIFRNPINIGQFPNRNLAVSYALSDYIITVDSDDKIYDYSISYLMDSMNQYPDSSFGMHCPGLIENTYVPSDEAIYNHFFKKPFLNHGPGGTIFKKSFFNKIGKYPINYGVPGDMYFNLNAGFNSPIVLLSSDFMYYRRHEGQEINNSYDYLINNYKYLKDALNNIPFDLSKKEIKYLNDKNKRRFTVNLVKYLVKTKNFKKTLFAANSANFKLKDAIQGVFH